MKNSELELKLILIKTDKKTGEKLKLNQQENDIQNQNQDSLYKLEEKIASYKKLNKIKSNYLIKLK
tara:strand:- start:454 stop:651 length:198 start_codon:yes stop_codon:yes gene_type:complete